MLDGKKLQEIPPPLVALADEYPACHIESAHCHRRAQLLYASRGVMSVLSDGSTFIVPPRHAVWLPPGVRHEVRCRNEVSLRTLYIEPHSVSELPGRSCVLLVSDLLRALILAAIDLPAHYDPDGREGRIVALLLDEIGRLRAMPLSIPMPADARLTRLCRAFLKNPAGKQTQEYWARVAGMSRRHLTRTFRLETGMSLATWQQHARLLEALSLLGTGQTVTAVALDVGYGSPSAFTARFRRTFGTTPRDYASLPAWRGTPQRAVTGDPR